MDMPSPRNKSAMDRIFDMKFFTERSFRRRRLFKSSIGNQIVIANFFNPPFFIKRIKHKRNGCTVFIVDAPIVFVGLTPQGDMDVPKTPSGIAWFGLGTIP